MVKFLWSAISLPRSQVNERAQLQRQLAHIFAECRNYAGGLLSWELDQHREARMALDERSHVRVVGARQQVAFPMPGNGAVLDFGRTFSDRNRIDDLSRQPAWRGAAFRIAHAPPGPQMPDQLFLEHPAGLDKQT